MSWVDAEGTFDFKNRFLDIRRAAAAVANRGGTGFIGKYIVVDNTLMLKGKFLTLFERPDDNIPEETLILNGNWSIRK